MDMALTYVVPLFLIMIFGVFAKKLLGFNSDHSKFLVKYVMCVAIPCDILVTFSHYSLINLIEHLKFIEVFSIVTIIVFTLGYIYSTIFKKRTKIESLFFAGSTCLSNACMLAFPILIYIMGSIGAIYGLLSVIVLIFGLQIINFISIRSDDKSDHPNAKAFMKITKDVLKSTREPFFISLILGLILSEANDLFGFKLPTTIHKTLDYFAITTAPVALFAVGINIDLYSLKKHFLEIIEASLFKLILMPLVSWYLARALHLNPETTIAIMICSVIATAKCLYGVAQQKKIYEKQIAAIVASTTILTVISLSCVLTFLNYYYPTYFANLHHFNHLK